jgi:hypothetical protein
MSSPPKPDDDNVAQSTTPEEGNAEVDQGPSPPKVPGKDDIMDDSHDIEVKEQDRWLPIANG